MPVIHCEERLLIVKFEFNPEEIDCCLAAHRNKWGHPIQIEKEGEKLLSKDFPDDESANFVLKVVDWGKGFYICNKFKTGNETRDIASKLRQASKLVNDCNQPEKAVSEVQQLNFLGQSFASKIVRFMHPEHAVILDSVIRDNLGYPQSEEGYNEFLDDCRTILDSVRGTHPNLRICDIESVIYAKLQGYC